MELIGNLMDLSLCFEHEKCNHNPALKAYVITHDALSVMSISTLYAGHVDRLQNLKFIYVFSNSRGLS